jgi:hypothetical protein
MRAEQLLNGTDVTHTRPDISPHLACFGERERERAGQGNVVWWGAVVPRNGRIKSKRGARHQTKISERICNSASRDRRGGNRQLPHPHHHPSLTSRATSMPLINTRQVAAHASLPFPSLSPPPLLPAAPRSLARSLAALHLLTVRYAPVSPGHPAEIHSPLTLAATAATASSGSQIHAAASTCRPS